MSRSYRQNSDRAVREQPVYLNSPCNIAFDSVEWIYEPATYECSNGNCGSERPIEDMTGCDHCDRYYCSGSGGCYEQHYEQRTGGRYSK